MLNKNYMQWKKLYRLKFSIEKYEQESMQIFILLLLYIITLII